MNEIDWVVLPHPAAVGRYAAERAIEIMTIRATGSDQVTVAIAGGSTPRHMHRALAGPLSELVPWSNLVFLIGDERAVPPDDEASNFRSAQETLFSKAPIRAHQVHRPRGEATNLDEAAREYERTLKTLAGTPPKIDLVFLGMGDDGHTASLFPGEPEPDGWYAVTRAPPDTPSALRLSLTYRAIVGARKVIVMVTGTPKASRVAQAIQETGSLPLQRILHERTEGTSLIMDEAAAERIERNVP